MSIFVQNMLQFKEREKALYAFVSDTETWVECGRMRRTWSTTKSEFRHCEEIQSNETKRMIPKQRIPYFCRQGMDYSGR